MEKKEDFKALLERYKHYDVSREEKSYVEEELKKAEAIQKYLFQTEDDTEPEEPPAAILSVDDKPEGTVKRKGLRLIAAVSTVLLMLLVCSFFFGRSVLSQLYFDPTKGGSQEAYSEYQLYEKIKNQVVHSETALQNIEIQQTGIGKYKINSSYFDSFNNETRVKSTIVERNKRQDQPILGVYSQPFFSGIYSVAEHPEMPANSGLDQLREKIKGLPKTSAVSVSLMFEQYDEVKLEAIQEWLGKEEQVRVLSAGIASSQDQSGVSGWSLFGLRFADGEGMDSNYDYFSKAKQVNEMNEKYPELFSNNYFTLNSPIEKLTQQYASRLNFLWDQRALGEEIERIFQPELYGEFPKEREDEAELYAEIPTFNEELEEAKKFFDEKGLIVRELTVVIQPDMFETLLKSELISSVLIQGVSLESSLLWIDPVNVGL